MKGHDIIGDVKTYICNAYRTNWVFVKIFTNSGIYGVGEATLEYKEHAVEAAIRELSRTLLGKDSRNIESIWQECYRDAYWRGGPVLMSTLSAVEMALWDIKGKCLGVPVYELLGGKLRDSVPCYANAWFSGAKTSEEFAECARKAVSRGFRGLKWDPFGSEYMNISPKKLADSLECIDAVKEAVGGSTRLIIEGHGRFNVPTTVMIGNALKDFGITWFEEPIPPDDKKGMAWVRSKIDTPIAGGERIYSRFDYLDYLESECADYWQPDVSHVGGIGEVRKIASMAEARHLPVCPHNPSGPIANAATLQLAACVPNFFLLETMATDIPWRSKICTENIVFKDGMMSIPESPGLGVDICEQEIAKHPYEPHDLRHYKGTLTDIRPDGKAEDYFKNKSDI